MDPLQVEDSRPSFWEWAPFTSLYDDARTAESDSQSDCMWGAVIRGMELVIPSKFEWLAPFKEGLACFAEKGRYGFCDVNGAVTRRAKVSKSIGIL